MRVAAVTGYELLIGLRCRAVADFSLLFPHFVPLRLFCLESRHLHHPKPGAISSRSRITAAAPNNLVFCNAAVDVDYPARKPRTGCSVSLPLDCEGWSKVQPIG